MDILTNLPWVVLAAAGIFSIIFGVFGRKYEMVFVNVEIMDAETGASYVPTFSTDKRRDNLRRKRKTSTWELRVVKPAEDPIEPVHSSWIPITQHEVDHIYRKNTMGEKASILLRDQKTLLLAI